MAKKAQAALEFLMTYGWALMMIAVIIGAFAYLGFTNPENFIHNTCTITTGFDCPEIGWIENSSAPGEIYLVLLVTNVNQNDVIIPDWDADLSISPSEHTGNCDSFGAPIQIAEDIGGGQYKLYEHTTTIERKEKHMLLIPCYNMEKGKKYKVSFKVPYRELRTRYVKALEGEVIIEGIKTIPQYDLI